MIQPTIARSPVSLADLDLMKKTALLGDEDVRWLRASRPVLESQVEQILDVWYGFVGSNPHLVRFFADKAGKPDARYLAEVRKRFGQWILDTADATFDQAWLDQQHEIGLRHHRTKKNRTDSVQSVENIDFRYLIPLIGPIVLTLEPFLAKEGASPEEVKKMQQAWLKSVLVQVALWSQPYVKPGDF